MSLGSSPLGLHRWLPPPLADRSGGGRWGCDSLRAGVLATTYSVGLFFTLGFGPFAAGPIWLFAGPMVAGALLGWSLGLDRARIAAWYRR